MSFSTLHDVPLLRIFYYLPMCDLLFRVNLVCHRWNDLLPTACSQRRSLVLLIGYRRKSVAHLNPFGIPFLSELKDGDTLSGVASLRQLEDSKFSEWSRIEFWRLSTVKIARITSVLPNIISLTLIEDCPKEHSLYFQLLWSIWADNLVTLKIIFNASNYDHFESGPTYFWNGLFGRIFELSKLKNVNIYCDRNIDCVVKLKLICKLEKFNLYLPDDNIEFGVWESLRRLASHRIRQLGLLNCFPRIHPALDYDCDNRDSPLSVTFTHLSFNRILNFDIGHFKNVTTVKLSNFDRSRPLSVYFLPLSHLPQLIHVILCFVPYDPFRSDFRNVRYDEQKSTLLAKINSDVQLTSVKVLSLHFMAFWSDCNSFGYHLFKILVNFFPKVKFLSFLANEYGCGPPNDHAFCPTYYLPEKVHTCLRNWFRILMSAQTRNPKEEEEEEKEKLSLLTHVEINIFRYNLYRKWSVEDL